MFVAKCINEAIRVGAFAQQLRTSTEPSPNQLYIANTGFVHRYYSTCTGRVQPLYRICTALVQPMRKEYGKMEK